MNLKEKVEERVNLSSNKIILSVFEKLVKTHNELCDCEYCIILSKYIFVKKELGRAKRDLNFLISLDLCNESEYRKAIENIECLKEKIKELKVKKDSLKNIF